jgi:predicted RNase H-like HicB family nuclease
LERAKSLEEAGQKIKELLGLVKEDKIERLKEMLWMNK